KRAEYIVGTTHQQATEILIPCLGNPQLLVRFTRLIPPGRQAKESSHLSASCKPITLLQSQDKRQSGQWTNSCYLLQACRFRITFAAAHFDFTFVCFYFLRQASYL